MAKLCCQNHNPKVPGSSIGGPTIKIKRLADFRMAAFFAEGFFAGYPFKA